VNTSYYSEIESHLVRCNGGHLVRIVGPAFDLVRSWEERGIPLKAVFRGIDRYVERHEAKGPRRRPVRIEFCEADVLDVFDEWRRAVGLSGTGGAGDADGRDAASDVSRKRESLAAHLDRVVARLTALRGAPDRAFDAVLEETVREIDVARASARHARGEARRELIDRLRAMDQRLLTAARQAVAEPELAGLAAEADAELAPFRNRMPVDTYARSHGACIDRLVRERTRLPVISFDP
jgi:hypothetical protein